MKPRNAATASVKSSVTCCRRGMITLDFSKCVKSVEVDQRLECGRSSIMLFRTRYGWRNGSVRLICRAVVQVSWAHYAIIISCKRNARQRPAN